MEHRKEAEAVYFAQEDSHIVMSEKVQALAGSIYQEFERMITKYDEEVVKDLMPLVVNVLECLDLSYTENQEHEVEVELLREDNEQLVTQYEREKSLRKTSEQKLLELEDHSDEMIKDLSGKIESLEAILRMLELKAKNAADHVSRLEEKENEMKKEYAKLHDRYTELFKTHMDYMERTKILMGTDRLENFGMSGMNRKLNNMMTRSAGPMSYGFESLANNSSLKSLTSPEGTTLSMLSPGGRPPNIQEEMTMDDVSEAMPDNDISNGADDDFDELSDSSPQQIQASKSKTKKEERTSNTLYQECSFQEPELAEEGGEITGSWVHPGEYASNVNDNFFGMGKEVENLILENSELLATKNALNIVKDDLIAKVDELTSEQEIFREEIASLNAVKSRMKLRIQELEEDFKKTKEEFDKKVNSKSDDEEDVPLAQRKRFTRVEMARVLMERNQYKERYMELQDAVRWTEMLRAAKQDPSMEKRNNRGILNFFSNLFSKGPAATPITTDRLVSTGGMVPHVSPTRGSNVSGPGSAGSDAYRASRVSCDIAADKLQLRRLGDPQHRRDTSQYSKIKAHVRKDDGRMQAYGWSLPAKSTGSLSAALPGDSSANSRSQSSDSQASGRHLPVPVPIYCRPFMEQTPGMKIFCASGVNLSGFHLNENRPEYTSHVWVCTATHSASRVTVIDANRPAEVLLSFEVCSSHLLCISSVPGAEEIDFQGDDGIHNFNPSDEPMLEDEASIGLPDRLVSVCFVKTSEETEEQTRPHSSSSATNDNSINVQSSTKSIEVTCEAGDDALEGLNPKQVNSMENSPQISGDFGQQESLQSTESDMVDVTSRLPTMWLGAQSGYVYIHSAIANRNKCLHKVLLPDSILSIAHLHGRTFVSMANGTVAIFRRDSDGIWDLSGYHLLDWGQPHHSIRCLSVVHGDIWCGFRNKIYVLDVGTLQLKKTFEAHPRRESQVRQMAWCGDGVWISIRLDSTLRLYHAKTHEHLQDVDIEPYVSKMLGTGKLGFSYARITALLVASQRLWIGTGNGVIISVPLSESTFTRTNPFSSQKSPGNVVRVSGEESGKDIPFCSMPQAQLSFHGHRDAVKFFVAVSGGSTTADLQSEGEEISRPVVDSMLVISGGEGYIDFRVVDEADGDTASHLIVWKLPQILDPKNPFLDLPVLTSLPEDP